MAGRGIGELDCAHFPDLRAPNMRIFRVCSVARFPNPMSQCPSVPVSGVDIASKSHCVSVAVVGSWGAGELGGGGGYVTE